MAGNTITHQVAITFIHDKFNELFKHFLWTQRKKECFNWSLNDTKVTLLQNLNSLGKPTVYRSLLWSTLYFER